MLPKPSICKGCPWYGDGKGFVPDDVPPSAKIIFCGQNPGVEEEFLGKPFIGSAGQLLRHDYVIVHLPVTIVGYANIVKCRRQDKAGHRSNEMPRVGTQQWQEVVRTCTKNHLRLPSGALLVPCGEHAHRFFEAPEGPVLHVRGTYLEG